jgi:hypothetical protein
LQTQTDVDSDGGWRITGKFQRRVVVTLACLINAVVTFNIILYV